jgi:ADP-ribose pyrophosphatase
LTRLLSTGAVAERRVESEIVMGAAALEFRRDEFVRPDGSRHSRLAVGHPGAVAILAVDVAKESDTTRLSDIILVRQFRAATGRPLLEVPAGTIDTVNGQREEASSAAARELEEETGLTASGWRHLRSFFTAPGFTDEWMELHLALGLHAAGEGRRMPDGDEDLEVVRLTIAEAAEGVRRGAIVDAKSLIAIGLAEAIASGERP